MNLSILPKGWELPTNEDWDQLLAIFDDTLAAPFKDVAYWPPEEPNTNEIQFSVRPTGYGNNGEFDNVFGSKTYFWSRTDHAEHIWTYIFEVGNPHVRKAEQHPTYALSVRCIQKK